MKDDLLLDRNMPQLGESKMNENQARPNLIDTTDCLEAVEVFKGWKNLLFIIVLLCLLALQGVFWMVDTGWVKNCDDEGCIMVSSCLVKLAAIVDEDKAEEASNEIEEAIEAKVDENAIEVPEGLEVADDISQAAKEVIDPNAAVKTEEAAADEEKEFEMPIKITFGQIEMILKFVNFILIIAAIGYCFTLLLTLKVSLIGRLGGINHISRALFMSVLMCVFLLPWQNLFSPMVSGMMFSADYLIDCYSNYKSKGVFFMSLYYLRFVGYWLLVLLLLIQAQVRSRRWARAILRRLEVI